MAKESSSKVTAASWRTWWSRDVWKRLGRTEPTAALVQLTECGCDHHLLVRLCGYLAIGNHSLEDWRGFAREFDTAMNRLRKCAEDVRRLNESVIGKSIIVHADPRIRGFLLAMPDVLRFYATSFEKAISNPGRAGVIAIIVRHVEDCTGRPHDAEVSELIAAALDNPNYSVQAHKNWRVRHRSLVASARLRVDWRTLIPLQGNQ